MNRRRTRDRSQGQALVEFALVLPVLVLLVMGLFDLGRAVFFYSELSNAARAGARVAMVNQSHDATCGTSVETYRCAAADMAVGTGIAASAIAAASFSDADGNIVTLGADVCAAYSACFATVEMDYTFTPITPIIGNIIGPISLSASSTMPIERTYVNPANP